MFGRLQKPESTSMPRRVGAEINNESLRDIYHLKGHDRSHPIQASAQRCRVFCRRRRAAALTRSGSGSEEWGGGVVEEEEEEAGLIGFSTDFIS